MERKNYNKNIINNDIDALKGLQNEKEMFIWDKQNHEYNNEKSERELYRYYKNLDKVVD